MADQDKDTTADMDDAIEAGGREEMAKDATRRAAQFRGAEDERPVEDMLKGYRRGAARQKRQALDRAMSRQPTGR